MRKGLFITGVIILLIGLVSIAYPMFIGSSVAIVAWPNAVSPAPPLAGSGTFTVHWTGGTSTTHVVLYECTTSDCVGLGAELANASGASGTLSVSLTAGHAYALTEYGTPISVPATVTIMGITLLILIGIVLLLVGVVVMALSFRRPSVRAERASAPSVAEESPAERIYAAPPPVTPMMEAPVRAAPPRQAEDPSQYAGDPRIAAAPQPVAGQRANLTCASCGTVNEPWITNCRKCKRPLASTSR